MVKRLILVGGGASAREYIDLSDAISSDSQDKKITAYIDDTGPALDGSGYQLEYLGSVHHYVPDPGDEFVMAIASPEAKKKISQLLRDKGAKFAQLIHPSAAISATAKLGEGVIIGAHAFVSANAKIGDLVAINALCSVGHDVDLGSFSTLSAHVDLTGYVQVGEGVFFGSGARVLPRVKIGSGAKIGIGATVMRTVPSNAVMYIQPAKKL